jgi:DNA repair exonuclease SbcCD nuclease subunit
VRKISDKRINIFTGHFGSGKTEVSVNYAIKLIEKGKITAIVDFDIVNPYFRTADVKELLEKKGIWVVTSQYANTNVDVPALPPEINTIFEKKEYTIVLDVGGDEIGARVLSRYREEILKDDYEIFFVVSARRPMTDTAEKIVEVISEIEYSSRLKITKLVNNTNLLDSTEIEDIVEGQRLVEEVSARLNIPIAFTSGFSEVMKEYEKGVAAHSTPLFMMDKLIKLPWE